MRFDAVAEYQLDISRLKKLVPIRDLSDRDQQLMIDKMKLIDLLPGDRVNVMDEHRWLLYLIEGDIMLYEKGKQGMPDALSATQRRAQYPLFADAEHQGFFQVKTNSWFVRFDRQLFNTLLEAEILGGEELETIEIDEVEGQLFTEIMSAYNNEQLQLPSLPEIALKVKAAVSHPLVEAGDVARIIEADPALATRLIQIANSPFNKGMTPVKSIKEAVVRLGLSSTRSLVMSLSMKQLFTSKSEVLKARMTKLYEHSVEIAAISAALAREVKTFEIDRLLLAGLVHDIGVIPVLNYIDKTGYEVIDENELSRVITTLRYLVGDMVVKSWGLPGELSCVIEHAENWQYDSGDSIDMAELILLAHIYAMLFHKDVKHLPKMDQVPACRKLFSEQKNQISDFAEHVLDNARQEISEVKRLLGITSANFE